jgi:protein-S-isoprenylcysteine O-methyltransferase Ste14
MTLEHRYLVVRAASLYITVAATAVIWIWRRPANRSVAGALMGAIWNLPIVLALQVAATRFGWWRFDAHGGLLLGMPVEMYLSWVWLWGAVPALAFPSLSLAAVILIALAADLVLMPAASPVLQLGPSWLLGEGIALLCGLLPGQLLARWTARGERLDGRATLQVLAFAGVVLFVLPAIVIEGTSSTWRSPLDRPAWQVSLIVQALACPAILGLTAVQEFVKRGGGTPIPFDPPRQLVTTGVYAYVRNPMQLSAVMLLFLWGLLIGNPWVSAAGVMAHVYSAGLAGWDEDEDLRVRFGDDWMTYRRAVRAWIPQFRPWHRPDRPAARLYVSERCDMCREVGRWFERRGALQLDIVAAETHPSGRLTRITYEPGDRTAGVTGIEAVARSLEHVHLGWAFVGFLLRLPVVRQLTQLLTDASGGEARAIALPRVAR